MNMFDMTNFEVNMGGKKYIKVAQITDIHMLNKKNEIFRGSNPYKNFKEIMHTINKHGYDYLLFTGDISEEGMLESYRLVNDLIGDTLIPYFFIPGNHDNVDNMKEVFKERCLNENSSITFLNWELLWLDTKIKQKPYGYIPKKSYNLVNQRIITSEAENIGIIMHHHPKEVGTPLIDKFNIHNGYLIEQELIQHEKVKLIMFGHVHNNYEFWLNEVFCSSAPATCLQFPKGTTTLESEYSFGYKEYIFNVNEVKTNCIWNHQHEFNNKNFEIT